MTSSGHNVLINSGYLSHYRLACFLMHEVQISIYWNTTDLLCSVSSAASSNSSTPIGQVRKHSYSAGSRWCDYFIFLVIIEWNSKWFDDGWSNEQIIFTCRFFGFTVYKLYFSITTNCPGGDICGFAIHHNNCWSTFNHQATIFNAKRH